MANKVETSQDVTVAEAVSKTEKFFEEHGKKFLAILVAVIVIIAGAYMYKHMIVDKNADKALTMIVDAQDRLSGENPEYEKALNGDENGAGLLSVIENYGSTPAGNLAKHYAGVCYLHLGDFEKAKEYLSKYSPVKGIMGSIINAQNLGLQGDIAVEQDNLKEAVKLYDEATKKSVNDFTTPLYLYKKGLALTALGQKAEAKACYEKILSQYATSTEAREADKLIANLE
ncbi:MAG: tetratricopeptide repeat protein [Alistipes sp.]|nr:tetratricopeptide repeat protein [Candidatus Alistipes equi]